MASNSAAFPAFTDLYGSFQQKKVQDLSSSPTYQINYLQHKVKVGATLLVEKLAGAGEAGATVELDRVLMIGGDAEGEGTVGTPTVAGARVVAEVVNPDAKGEKLIVFKYKNKVRYRKKTGHRQHYTQLKVTDIVTGS